jgi:hypothetical protein
MNAITLDLDDLDPSILGEYPDAEGLLHDLATIHDLAVDRKDGTLSPEEEETIASAAREYVAARLRYLAEDAGEEAVGFADDDDEVKKKTTMTPSGSSVRLPNRSGWPRGTWKAP